MSENKNPALRTDVTVPPQKESGLKRRNIRKWVLRITLGFAILSPLVFIVGAIGAKLGLWGWQFGLGTLTRQVGPKVLMASLALGLISLLLAYFVRPRKGFFIGAVAVILPVLGFAHLKSVQSTAQKLPAIHDITTDTQDVPKFGALILAERAEVEGVNTVDYIGKMAATRDAEGNRGQKLVSVLQTKAYPDIRSIVIGDDKEVAFGKAKAVAEQMGWDVKVSDLSEGRIEATDTTFWYGFKDDVIIRLRDSEGGGTLIDVRSVSRVGRSDLGKNADRIRKFLEKMKAGD
ncbi:uncharacterized protein DUF1499 [Litorimonas taeanensis]|uniref:Uncharacterized protein DUF1499 n=1 Tax=Litorimonas taeanensis TaxID=568099 RepID=A0A420WIU4_9PROT|nr:DUF1499 domain-containing protein [Litorimonas taeanensis]RKQ70866.1 uncharacterized protein DUF1499 [Litorimonas taeanensis]